MSDYFDALMRSSGMPIGGAAPAIAPPAIVPPATVPPQQAVAPVPVVHRVEQPAAPAPEGTDHAARGGPAAPTGITSQPPARALAAEKVAASQPAAAPVAEPPLPARGPALVRAAMQWVAAGPQQAPGIEAPMPPRERSLPAVIEATSVSATSHVIQDRDAAPEARSPAATPRRDTAPLRSTAHASPHEPEQVQVVPTRSARLSAVPPMPVAPPVRDEVVEVSIGAIHVRVDAPALQTVAGPAVTSPATAAPRAGSTTLPRSALSRRALRRI